MLDNQSLFSICEMVKSSDKCQKFFLISELFSQIGYDIYESRDDFTILLNDIKFIAIVFMLL
jgi:hypothetical protein